jgi:branched-subunit amino acid aminotransferase/4-amino-4-deoxychorismate lyase
MANRLAVMIDGELVPADDPVRVTMDDGLIRGDGIFEGIRAYGRMPRTPDAHLERLARSGDGAGIPVDVEQLRAEMAAFCQATVSPDCAIRLIITRGGIRIWREEPIPPARSHVDLLPVAHRVTPLLVGVKTLSYAANMRAQRMAKDAGMDDALLYRADDRVILEGPIWSFAWLEGDDLVFPPLASGVLDSITRRVVEEAVPTVEREAPVEDLARASGGFLISSVAQIVPVRTVLGVAEFDVDTPRVREIVEAVDACIMSKVEPVGAPSA